MIYDTFENMDLYFDKTAPLHRALSFAVGFDKSQPDGRYDIDGDNIYALVMSYDTKDGEEVKFESHKKYIDIQLLLEGVESLNVSLDKNLNIDTLYSEQNDVALFTPPKYFASVLLEPGNFAVLYPDDTHQPGCRVEDKKQVRKMVIKVCV